MAGAHCWLDALRAVGAAASTLEWCVALLGSTCLLLARRKLATSFLRAIAPWLFAVCVFSVVFEHLSDGLRVECRTASLSSAIVATFLGALLHCASVSWIYASFGFCFGLAGGSIIAAFIPLTAWVCQLPCAVVFSLIMVRCRPLLVRERTETVAPNEMVSFVIPFALPDVWKEVSNPTKPLGAHSSIRVECKDDDMHELVVGSQRKLCDESGGVVVNEVVAVFPPANGRAALILKQIMSRTLSRRMVGDIDPPGISVELCRKAVKPASKTSVVIKFFYSALEEGIYNVTQHIGELETKRYHDEWQSQMESRGYVPTLGSSSITHSQLAKVVVQRTADIAVEESIKNHRFRQSSGSTPTGTGVVQNSSSCKKKTGKNEMY